MACARVTARKIGAAFRQVPGAHHYPHVDSPSEVNTLLAEFWAQAESDRPEARPPGRHCPRSNRALLHFRSRQYRTAVSAKVAGWVAAGLAGRKRAGIAGGCRQQLSAWSLSETGSLSP